MARSGVASGIASYKSAWLARLLTKAGALVDVVLTRGATEFIGGITFEALTGRPVHSSLFEEGRALDHIALARNATAIVVAPATADFIARSATGQAPDLLGAVLLAAKVPVLIAPAMNDQMWSHAQTQQNVNHLRSLGYTILEPATGELAAGEGSGPGRMPEPEVIFGHVGRLLEKQSLRGTRVLVTAGPTREPLDPVRFISNRSSGKMGIALAEAAWRRGAEVSLVAGPLEVSVPSGIDVEFVESTAEMNRAIAGRLSKSDVLIMAAAPADFQAAEVATSKIKRGAATKSIAVRPTDDILTATKARRKKGSITIGFALETGEAVNGAKKKLTDKSLDLIVANDASEEGAGFSVDTNRVTLIDRHGHEEALPLMTKVAVAEEILDRVERLRGGR